MSYLNIPSAPLTHLAEIVASAIFETYGLLNGSFGLLYPSYQVLTGINISIPLPSILSYASLGYTNFTLIELKYMKRNN